MNRRSFLRGLGALAALAVIPDQIFGLLPANKKSWQPSDWRWEPEQYMGDLKWVSFPLGKKEIITPYGGIFMVTTGIT